MLDSGLDELRRRHRRLEKGDSVEANGYAPDWAVGRCESDLHPWPCPTNRLFRERDAYKAALRKIERACAALARARAESR
jgi:hypothetical protein